MSRTIGIISAKGGVGKTVITANLLASMVNLSRDVIAVDADIKVSGLGLQLGMYAFNKTLNDILKRRASLLEALYIHSSGLRIIPASLCVENVDLSRLKSTLNDRALADKIILIDAPPGLEKNSLSILNACDEALAVTLPEIPSMIDTIKTIVAAERNNCKLLGVIVNRYKKRSEQLTLDDIESVCGLPVVGVIPEDTTILKSIFRRTPAVFLDPYAISSLQFRRMAHELLGIAHTPIRYPRMKRLLRRLRP